MNIQIRYPEQPGMAVDTVSVIGSFNGYDAASGKMRLEENDWIYEAKLPAGEYYYKFLLNGEVLLNDPEANSYVPRKEEETELWSYLKVNHVGERLYNNSKYAVNVADYQLSAAISTEHGTEKHYFSSVLDKKVVARFGFDRVTGIHPVTVLWCDRAGTVREYTEQLLLPLGEGEEQAVLWFWLDIEKQEPAEGGWTVKLFIDGQFILEDNFQIGNTFLYTRDGKLKNT